jgi:hypothetical protein
LQAVQALEILGFQAMNRLHMEQRIKEESIKGGAAAQGCWVTQRNTPLPGSKGVQT